MRSLRSVGLAAASAALLFGSSGCSSSTGGHTDPTQPGTSSPSSSTSATSRELSFTSDGTTAYGTLEIPAHRAGQHLAAALLLPGSGPTDRNGDQAGGEQLQTLKLFSDILVRQGIITFRFDKYFTGKTGAGKLAADPQNATVQDDLRQAAAAYQLLSTQSQVDQTKMLVVGHSEGGMFALNVATTESVKPAGLALMEPQDGRILDLVRIQFDEALPGLVQAGKLTTAQVPANEQAIARATAAFRAQQPVSTDGMAPAVVALVSPLLIKPTQALYIRTWDTVRPGVLATKVQRGTQVLVTDGTRDTNVPTSTVQPFAAALKSAGTIGPGLKLIQGIDHDMHLASQPASQAVLAPAIVTDLQQWAAPFSTR